MNDTPYFLVKHLFKPMFVIQMGWPRWGPQAKGLWVYKLKCACQYTIRECDKWSEGLSERIACNPGSTVDDG